MAKSKRSKMPKSTASPQNNITLAIRPGTQAEPSYTEEIPQQASDILCEEGSIRVSISRQAAKQVKSWQEQWGPYTRANKEVAKYRGRYKDAKADEWLQTIVEAIAEISSIRSKHPPANCHTCSKGSCAMFDRHTILQSIRDKSRHKLVMLEALKLYTSLGEANRAPILPPTIEVGEGSSSSELLEVENTECDRDQDAAISEEQDIPRNRAGTTSGERKLRKSLRKKTGFKIKRSASDVDNSDHEHQIDTQTPNDNDFVAVPSIEDSMIQVDLRATKKTKLRNKNSRHHDQTERTASKVRETKRKVNERSPEQSFTPKKVKKLSRVSRTCGDLAETSNRIKIETGTEQPVGDTADTAIEIEEDSDDEVIQPTFSGVHASTEGYRSLRKNELLHLVRQLKAEKATQCHKTKIREFVCKHKGVTPEMIVAFETKISSKRKWDDAAVEVFGPTMGAEDNDAPQVKRSRKARN